MARQGNALARQLREALGDKGFGTLVKAFGGQRIRVPSGAQSQADALRRRILRDFACQCEDPEHHSYRGIARRLGVSAATVYRYANLAYDGEEGEVT